MIPVHLITGFLGSGKTTLLNRLLRDPRLGDAAVVVNEFGEIAIDHALVSAAEEDLTVLRSGCICCSIRGDLVDALSDLAGRRAAGAAPAFSRVLLETTGLADPGPVLQTLMTDPALLGRYCAGAVITVVDAVHGADHLARRPEAARQAAFADRIVLSKRDLAGPPDDVTARLRAIDETVPILDAADVEPAALLDGTPPPPSGRASLDAPDIEAHCAGHAPDIKAHCIVIDRPLDWRGLVRWLDALTSLRGGDVLRIKGIVRVRGRKRPVAINAVHHALYPPVALEGWPDGRKETRLVAITQGIGALDLQRALEAAGALDAEA